MRFPDIETSEQLHDFMTTPSDALVKFCSELTGDLLVMGVGGKMGPELVETMLRADRRAGMNRTVHAASRFSDPDAAVERDLAESGAVVHKGDFTERSFLKTLPDAPNIIFMAGMKFGAAADHRRTFHLNCIMPYLVGERFPRSRVVVYSSGNPYPHTTAGESGCRETEPLAPVGAYGWSIVARESAFETTASRSAAQQVCFFRLMYAQHLAYGVLVDLARMVHQGRPVSLRMPAVNIVSQRDAIDRSLRALSRCNNPPFILNCAGPVVHVPYIAERIAELMECEARFLDDEGEAALLADDELCVRVFGPYRDTAEQMIEGAARWVMHSGESWDKPTLFWRTNHNY